MASDAKKAARAAREALEREVEDLKGTLKQAKKEYKREIRELQATLRREAARNPPQHAVGGSSPDTLLAGIPTNGSTDPAPATVPPIQGSMAPKASKQQHGASEAAAEAAALAAQAQNALAITAGDHNSSAAAAQAPAQAMAPALGAMATAQGAATPAQAGQSIAGEDASHARALCQATTNSAELAELMTGLAGGFQTLTAAVQASTVAAQQTLTTLTAVTALLTSKRNGSEPMEVEPTPITIEDCRARVCTHLGKQDYRCKAAGLSTEEAASEVRKFIEGMAAAGADGTVTAEALEAAWGPYADELAKARQELEAERVSPGYTDMPDAGLGTDRTLHELLPQRTESQSGDKSDGAGDPGANLGARGSGLGPKPKLPDYNKFSGTLSNHVTCAKTWFDGLVDYVNVMYAGTAVGFKDVLPFFTSGKLQTWVTHLYRTKGKDGVTIEEIRREFLQRYGLLTREPAHESRQRLLSGEHHQTVGESAGEYTQRFRELLREAEGMDTITAINLYIKGLNARLRKESAAAPDGSEWTDLEELIRFTEGRERALELGRTTAGTDSHHTGSRAFRPKHRPSLAAVHAPMKKQDAARNGGRQAHGFPPKPPRHGGERGAGGNRGPGVCTKCDHDQFSKEALAEHLLLPPTHHKACAGIKRLHAQGDKIVLPAFVWNARQAGRGTEHGDPRSWGCMTKEEFTRWKANRA